MFFIIFLILVLLVTVGMLLTRYKRQTGFVDTFRKHIGHLEEVIRIQKEKSDLLEKMVKELKDSNDFRDEIIKGHLKNYEDMKKLNQSFMDKIDNLTSIIRMNEYR
jgi:hypothetical protein